MYFQIVYFIILFMKSLWEIIQSIPSAQTSQAQQLAQDQVFKDGKSTNSLGNLYIKKKTLKKHMKKKKSDTSDLKHCHYSWPIKDKISRSCSISCITLICPMQIPLKPLYPLCSICTPRLINKLENCSLFIKTLVLWGNSCNGGNFQKF